MRKETIKHKYSLMIMFRANIIILIMIIALVYLTPTEPYSIMEITAVFYTIYLLTLFYGYLTVLIINSSGSIIVEKRYFGFFFIVNEYSISEITVTYKAEIGAKGTYGEQFRIYRNNKIIYKIYPHVTGWSEKKLKKIKEDINKLKSVGVDKKEGNSSTSY